MGEPRRTVKAELSITPVVRRAHEEPALLGLLDHPEEPLDIGSRWSELDRGNRRHTIAS
jgi:hypothetical protein